MFTKTIKLTAKANVIGRNNGSCKSAKRYN